MTELFGDMYTPRRIRFLLHHWDALRALSEFSRSYRATFTQLAVEWKLIAEQASDPRSPSPPDCLCSSLNDGIPTREETGTSGHVHGLPLALDVRADLTAAADALPIAWQATRVVFALQYRADTWAARLATERRAGMPLQRDSLIEPPFYPQAPLRRGSGLVAVRLMALHRGWRPQVDDVA